MLLSFREGADQRMIHTVICGYGHMGKLIAQAIRNSDDMVICGILNHHSEIALFSRRQRVDLLLDFSHPDAFALAQRFVHHSGCALLSGTTGLSADQQEALCALGQSHRVMSSANYSLGVAVMCKLVKQAAQLLRNEFDMEIIELHHQDKQDAPSGTARQLLEVIDPDQQYEALTGRNGMIGRRGKEVGIHAVRGGTLAGEHTVLFLGEDEKLTIHHTAISRKIFVNGALKAARWLLNQGNGFYTIEQMIGGN